MNVSKRIDCILERIKTSETPVSGNILANEFSVTRQTIVKDISELKNRGYDIISTTRGYMIRQRPMPERIFKVVHSDEDTETELNAIVDAGGIISDVFVWHKIYGKIEAELNIRTREDVCEYIHSLKNGRSKPLKNVTNQYHYHTVKAADEQTLARAEAVLDSLGYLVIED